MRTRQERTTGWRWCLWWMAGIKLADRRPGIGQCRGDTPVGRADTGCPSGTTYTALTRQSQFNIGSRAAPTRTVAPSDRKFAPVGCVSIIARRNGRWNTDGPRMRILGHFQVSPRPEYSGGVSIVGDRRCCGGAYGRGRRRITRCGSDHGSKRRGRGRRAFRCGWRGEATTAISCTRRAFADGTVSEWRATGGTFPHGDRNGGWHHYGMVTRAVPTVQRQGLLGGRALKAGSTVTAGTKRRVLPRAFDGSAGRLSWSRFFSITCSGPIADATSSWRETGYWNHREEGATAMIECIIRAAWRCIGGWH